jgi:hypothetical protein
MIHMTNYVLKFPIDSNKTESVTVSYNPPIGEAVTYKGKKYIVESRDVEVSDVCATVITCHMRPVKQLILG